MAKRQCNPRSLFFLRKHILQTRLPKFSIFPLVTKRLLNRYLPLTWSLAKNEKFSTQNLIVSLGQNGISPRVVRLSPRDLESCMLGVFVQDWQLSTANRNFPPPIGTFHRNTNYLSCNPLSLLLSSQAHSSHTLHTHAVKKRYNERLFAARCDGCPDRSCCPWSGGRR